MNIDRLMDVLQTLRFESQRTLGLPGLLGGVALVAALIVSHLVTGVWVGGVFRDPRVSPTSFGKTPIYPLYLMQRTLSREDRADELAWGSRTATARNQPLQSR